METKKIRLGIFSQLQTVIQRLQTIGARDDLDIQLYPQGLDDAIPIGIEMEKTGVEVIISRRGTAQMLRKVLEIPVLSFPHRSIDMLMSLKEAAAKGRKVLVPMYSQKMSGIEVLESLLDIELKQVIYHDKESLGNVITLGKREGCDVVIGGSVCAQYSKVLDISFVETQTPEDDIVATVENAISAVLSNRQQKVIAREYLSIIDAASDGIVASDNTGIVKRMNQTARQILKINREDAIGASLAHVFPDCPSAEMLPAKNPLTDQLGKIRRSRFVFNHTPIFLENEIIGTVTTFKNISNVQKSEQAVRRSLSRGFKATYLMKDFLYVSKVMHDIVEMGKQFAKTNSTVLVMGETGTGKEILVQGIHNLSPRSLNPFVSINCAALPEQLLESELFGYEEGAFTGSRKGGKAGLFELAHLGTIFLDEIDSTPSIVQTRLLRVLQEREVMRLGGDRKIPIDVRVIAAAGRDPIEAVNDGDFRSDLFYRINVLRIKVPPLRERKEDIPMLLNFFMVQYTRRIEAESIVLPSAYLEKLVGYNWPGNIRQLKNFSERLVMSVSFKNTVQTLDDLYNDLANNQNGNSDHIEESVTVGSSANNALGVQEKSEKNIIEHALIKAKYNKKKAADLLQISRSTLWRKMRELKLYD